MLIALSIFSVFMVALSMYGVLLPSRLVGLVRHFMSGSRGLWFAVAVRLVLAALLWVNAPVSATPAIFKALAAFVLVAAITLPVVGLPRLRKWLEYFATWPQWAIRLLCVLGVAFGGFVLWSISSAIGA